MLRGIISRWILLFLFWMLLTGMTGAIDMGIGAIFALCLALLWIHLHDGECHVNINLGIRNVVRFIIYITHRIKPIIVANVDLAERLLDPRLPINPTIIKIPHKIPISFWSTALANSISLTPGTVTVDITNNDIYIHFLAEEYLDSILSSDLEGQIRWVITGEKQ